MTSKMILLPRFEEKVDIFDLPEDFSDLVKEAFGKFTTGTSDAYRDTDRLCYIDHCVNKFQGGAIEPEEAISKMVFDLFKQTWDEEDDLIGKNDIYCKDFLYDAWYDGNKRARLGQNFGEGDHHVYEQMRSVLCKIIKAVMDWEAEPDESTEREA